MRTVGSCMYTVCVHDCARARCRYTMRRARLLHIKLQREPRHEWQRLTKGFPNFRQRRRRREESTRAPLFVPPQMYGSHAVETQQSDKTLGFDSRGRAKPSRARSRAHSRPASKTCDEQWRHTFWLFSRPPPPPHPTPKNAV